jgi:ribosomal protein L7/L12
MIEVVLYLGKNMRSTFSFEEIEEAETFLAWASRSVDQEISRMKALKKIRAEGFVWRPNTGKIQQIKDLREVTGLSLAECKAIVEEAERKL